MIFGKRKTELRSWKSNYTTVIVKGKQQSLFFQGLDMCSSYHSLISYLLHWSLSKSMFVRGKDQHVNSSLWSYVNLNTRLFQGRAQSATQLDCNFTAQCSSEGAKRTEECIKCYEYLTPTSLLSQARKKEKNYNTTWAKFLEEFRTSGSNFQNDTPKSLSD